MRMLVIKHTYIKGCHLPAGRIDWGAAESGVLRVLIEESILRLLGLLKLAEIYH